MILRYALLHKAITIVMYSLTRLMREVALPFSGAAIFHFVDYRRTFLSSAKRLLTLNARKDNREFIRVFEEEQKAGKQTILFKGLY